MSMHEPEDCALTTNATAETTMRAAAHAVRVALHLALPIVTEMATHATESVRTPDLGAVARLILDERAREEDRWRVARGGR